jgi:hypothetical protein
MTENEASPRTPYGLAVAALHQLLPQAHTANTHGSNIWGDCPAPVIVDDEVQDAQCECDLGDRLRLILPALLPEIDWDAWVQGRIRRDFMRGLWVQWLEEALLERQSHAAAMRLAIIEGDKRRTRRHTHMLDNKGEDANEVAESISQIEAAQPQLRSGRLLYQLLAIQQMHSENADDPNFPSIQTLWTVLRHYPALPEV